MRREQGKDKALRAAAHGKWPARPSLYASQQRGACHAVQREAVSGSFPLLRGSRYCFRSRATRQAGNPAVPGGPAPAPWVRRRQRRLVRNEHAASAQAFGRSRKSPLRRDDIECRGATVLRPGPRLRLRLQSSRSLRAFRHAQSLDPKCAMCFWGEAYVLGPNLNLPMDDAAAPVSAEPSRVRRC